MRIYLAARYSRRLELCGYQSDLIGMGHEVTSSWLNGLHDTEDRTTCDVETRGHWAHEDIQDLAASERTISFTESPAGGRGGRHVEFGAALAFGQSLWIVGPREHVFHCLPIVRQFDTWAECLKALHVDRYGHD